MQSMQSVQSGLGQRLLPQPPDEFGAGPDRARPDMSRPDHEADAHREIARLRVEIERLVKAEGETARAVLDTALESVTRLQIATANIDACRPPSATFAGSALVALADSHLRGHSDAIERGMAYTADNQLRLLLSSDK
jgi:hypothetical protein